MSWTKLLVQRRFAPGATVILDLPCAKCGYNLRGARAYGRCAECGTLVRDSLRLLSSPDRVSGALAGLAKTYPALLVLVVGCAQPFMTTAIPELIIFVALAAGLAFRLFALAELRFRSDLQLHPTVGRPLRAYWLGSLGEAALLTATIAAVCYDHIAPPAAPRIPGAALGAAFLAWLASAFALLVVAAWLGRRLAAWLGYDAIRKAFVLLGWTVVAGFVLLPVPLAYGWFASPAAPGRTPLAIGAAALGIACALTWGLAIVLAFAAMLHLSEAASRERDELEEAIEGGRSEPLVPLAPTPPGEDIKLE